MSDTVLTATEDLVRMQLQNALTMEDDSLASLEWLEHVALSPEVGELFRNHQEETKQQIEHLHRVFGELGMPMLASPSPAGQGIAQQSEMLVAQAGPSRQDEAVLIAGLGSEHYEIAVYTALLASLADGEPEVAYLLHSNLDQEVRVSDALAGCLRKRAH